MPAMPLATDPDPAPDRTAVPPRLRRRATAAAIAVGAAGVAAVVGHGLAVSVARLLGSAALSAVPATTVGALGAIVGASVTMVAVPLALWARVPQRFTREARERRATVARLTTVAPTAPRPTPADDAPRAAAARPARDGWVAFDDDDAIARDGKAGATLRGAASAGGHDALATTTPALLAGIDGAGSLMQAAADLSAPHRTVRDALTGAYTQQHFMAAADREWARIRRHGEDAALLMVDVDHYGKLNDQHGRTCGDLVLIEITRLVAATLREYDLLARFQGGVLMVYLPHTDPLGALDVAERIRERIATFRMHFEGKPVRATVSVGVAGIGASHARLDEAIADAGAALREAKQAGRNCVRAAPIPPRRPATTGSPVDAPRA